MKPNCLEKRTSFYIEKKGLRFEYRLDTFEPDMYNVVSLNTCICWSRETYGFGGQGG